MIIKLHKDHMKCVKHAENAVKVVKIHMFLECRYKSQYFEQSPENFVHSHNCETVTDILNVDFIAQIKLKF